MGFASARFGLLGARCGVRQASSSDTAHLGGKARFGLLQKTNKQHEEMIAIRNKALGFKLWCDVLLLISELAWEAG